MVCVNMLPESVNTLPERVITLPERMTTLPEQAYADLATSSDDSGETAESRRITRACRVES